MVDISLRSEYDSLAGDRLFRNDEMRRETYFYRMSPVKQEFTAVRSDMDWE